jgi:ABC-2 type transport system permease protein
VIALIRSELRRARSRRLVPMVIVGCVLLIAIGIFIGAVNSHRPSAAQLDAAQRDYDASIDRCMSGKYVRPKGVVPPGYASMEEYCRDGVELYVGAGMQTRDLADVVQGSAIFTILIAVILASSLGGADWSAGTMATLLTWEPRRIRVLVARAIVVIAFVFVITFAIQALLVGAYALASSLRGWTGGTPPDLVESVVRMMLRVSTMGVALALIALSIAMIGRSTVAALGALFGYVVLFEGVVGGFAPATQDRLLMRAAGVVISRQPIYGVGEMVSQGNGVSLGGVRPILLGLGEAWVVVAFYVVVLFGLALLAFRSRDVN